MKTILTLLLATIAFGALHAQSREEARRVILGDRKDDGYDRRNDDVVWNGSNNRYPAYPNGGYESSRQNRIYQINRDYEAKIASVRNNRYLSNREKERTIRQLEIDRQRRIAEINREYNNDRGRYDNDRHDNGKHKGWFKKAKNKNWRKGYDD